MSIEIIAAESLGARSLCCSVQCADRRIVIDPGIALGFMRRGLQPHPLQIAEGRSLREKILQRLQAATDVVFSHFHGDHVPLLKANPYQLAIHSLPAGFSEKHCWSKSDSGDSVTMSKRFHDLLELAGNNMQIAEDHSDGPLTFSPAVPHGSADRTMGSVMMTRLQLQDKVFVHASDIQLLDAATVDRVLAWQPDVVLAAGPPLYLPQLGRREREVAWHNAIRLVKDVDQVILDHHLMRSEDGVIWLHRLAESTGRRLYCAADYMLQPRRLLEAERQKLYRQMPVPEGWHQAYGNAGEYAEQYLDAFLNGHC